MNHANPFPLERNRYFYGKLLTVRDFETEQRYHGAKRALVNRLIHGAGVVCGLGVTASDESTLMIESGMALDYQGREIFLPETLFRKLQMLEGQEELAGHKDAYLCLTYHEEGVEPVNAAGAEGEAGRQFDLTREGYRLFLSTVAPDYQELLEAAGRENVAVLYESEELTLIFSAPAELCAGEEAQVEVLVVKSEQTPPVKFSLEGENTFVDSENGRLRLEYREGHEETRCVYTVALPLRVKSFSQTSSRYFPAGCELNVELGSHHYKNYLTLEGEAFLCRDQEARTLRRRQADALNLHLRGRDLPLYLAKLELVHSAGGVFVGRVTGLPFGQSAFREEADHTGGAGGLSVTTSVRSLEYWQKPDVKAVYQASTGGLHLDFAIPSPEQYDYAVSHGTVDLALPGGIRVNSRVYSEEIAHGLGPGAVDVRLSVEFMDAAQGETALLWGNSEVFKSKTVKLSTPWVEPAAVVYPERGTLRIGLWLHDTVEGNLVRVHYFVQKPERDAGPIVSRRRVSLTVKPEFSRLRCRGKLQFQAEVVGSADKRVIWSVREENGGVIDRNGLYQAPELPGTYEIVAEPEAGGTAGVSAFVVVEQDE